MKIGFLGLLTIVFITLKLTNVIYWSWLWVLAPMWIPFAVFGVIAMFSGVSLILAKYLERSKK